jgi:RHH-type proline utilization regulon transcriptional repressor/proline dehydrogenase/delta 1-pyrroline-5-carboxylate dehydrogenase
VILVGSVATSARFRNQLIDGVTSLKVGYPSDPTTQMGPIIGPADGKLLSALTTLGPDESWLVEPRMLDKSGQLWSPGVRAGVSAGSEFHLTEYFGPVLGVMTARTLDEAIDMVNAIEYGLTSGLHSLESGEIESWLDRIEGGNLYVNRGTTGAIVQRQPFGGWKKSAVGAGSKAGGPNYLFGLGSWKDADTRARGADLTVDRVQQLLAALPEFDTVTVSGRAWLARAARLDEEAWQTEFGIARDVSNVGVERNVFRYRPIPIPLIVRFSDGAEPTELLRVLIAGFRAGNQPFLSASAWLETKISRVLEQLGVTVEIQTEYEWEEEIGRRAEELSGRRVRLVGGNPSTITLATGGRPDLTIWSGPVVTAARVEMLPFLREQAVSITAHRFGTPNNLTDAIELGH